MQDITELRRLASPAPRPQCLVFDGATLWMGSIETRRIYEIDHAAWKVRRDWDAETKKLDSVITVDRIRKLKEYFQLSAADGGKRVAIIDSADEMNPQAANALLKLLRSRRKTWFCC